MVKIGDRVETINFGWAEAITDQYDIAGKSSRGGLVDVRFDNTSTIRKEVYTQAFSQGCIRDGSVDVAIKVGQIWSTNNFGLVKVTGGDKNKNIEIVFLNTGNSYKVQKNALLVGFCKDQPSVTERKTKDREEIDKRVSVARLKAAERKFTIERNRIVREENTQLLRATNLKLYEESVRKKEERELSNKILIEKAHTIIESLDQTKEGKNLLNIDFKDRDGKWVLRYRNPFDKSFVQTRLGRLHNNVTQRASEGSALQDVHNKSYSGVKVSELFKDPQTFCDWVVCQEGWGFGYNLDKDLLSENNRTYSEDKCCFLPKSINLLLIYQDKATSRKIKEGFRAITSYCGKEINLGIYPTKEEAEEVCTRFKANRFLLYSEFFKNNISKCAYDKLIFLHEKYLVDL